MFQLSTLNLPDADDINRLFTSLDEIKKLLLETNRVEKPIKLTPAEKELSEIEYFIPLHLAWDKLSIGESTWYRNLPAYHKAQEIW